MQVSVKELKSDKSGSRTFKVHRRIVPRLPLESSGEGGIGLG